MLYNLVRLACVGYLVLSSQSVFAEIRIDGIPDEVDWQSAVVIPASQYQQIAPVSLTTPTYETESRFLSTAETLFVSVCSQLPADVARTRSVRPRDSVPMASDLVYLIIDSEGKGRSAFDFTVNISGVQRDGQIVNENIPHYDWNGEWQSAVNETDSGWCVEYGIPWLLLPGHSDQNARTLRVAIGRFTPSDGVRITYPAMDPTGMTVVSRLAPITIPGVTRSSGISFAPYGLVMRDAVNDDTNTKAGLDVNWVIDSSNRVVATINPDFGQVESDNLVVNFSALETYFEDRRPFFTENENIFTILFPDGSRAFHSRRFGGARDDGTDTLVDIDYAVKSIGTFEKFTYGLLTLDEEGASGKHVDAARSFYGSDFASVGFMYTHTKRPYFDLDSQTALVDGKFKTGESGTIDLLYIDTDRDFKQPQLAQIEDASQTQGYSFDWRQSFGKDLQVGLTRYRYDKDLNFNDSGFMVRNNVNANRAYAIYRYPFNGDNINTLTSTLSAWRSTNLSGLVIRRSEDLSVALLTKSASIYKLSYGQSRGEYDDLITRGNNPWLTDDGYYVLLSVENPPAKGWSSYFSTIYAINSASGSKRSVELNATYRPVDQLYFSATTYLVNEAKWSTWYGGNNIALMPANQRLFFFDSTWVPAMQHEFRLRWQWIGFKTEPGYINEVQQDGRLVSTGAAAQPFTFTQFATQLRYIYRPNKQWTLYGIYSRGGDEFAIPDESHMETLWNRGIDLRDKEQVVVKVVYSI